MKQYSDHHTNNPIERLKNLWADTGTSPRWFFTNFYPRKRKNGYKKFLLDLNYFEFYTTAIQEADLRFREYLRKRGNLG